MAKIVVECSDPNDLEAIEAASEQFVGRCNITYFKQAQVMQEVGTAKSQREAARKIAGETGETESAVEHRIRRGKNEVRQGGAPKSKPTEIIAHSTPEIIEKRKPQGGGVREGAGRKRKEVKEHIPGSGDEATEAMEFVTMAITNLERIRIDDPLRIEALKRIIQWAQKEKEKTS